MLIAATVVAPNMDAAAPAAMSAAHGTVTLADDFDPQQYTTKAKISMPQALSLALKKVPGRIAWAGLEDVGHFLYYSVEVVDANHAITMVTLDAGTGAVTAVESAAEKEKDTVDVGDAPASADPEKGGVPKESPELSMVKGSIAVPEHAKDSELPYLTAVSLDQAMRAINRRYRGKFLSVSVYREKETVMFGLELVQPGNKHIYFYFDPGTRKVLDTTKW